MTTNAARMGPTRVTRWIIGLVVGVIFLIPLVSTFVYTVRDTRTGEYTWDRWSSLFAPEKASIMKPLWAALGNSLLLALITVAIILLLVAPTMILVNLRFTKLKPFFEFIALLPISIPAIVLVVGLAPMYLPIGRMFGTGAWTLAFAYGIIVLPFAFRAIQASIDAVDMKTLAEAARTLGSSWFTVVVRVLAPNLRSGLLSASLISVAVVLGEYTIAALLNRQVLQTALLVIGKADPYAPAIFTLLALAFCFVLLLSIGLLARRRTGKVTS